MKERHNVAQKARRNECNEVEHKRDGASMRMRLDAKQATTAGLKYMAHCNTRPKGSTTPSSTILVLFQAIFPIFWFLYFSDIFWDLSDVLLWLYSR